jgi:hypothetical protein
MHEDVFATVVRLDEAITFLHAVNFTLPVIIGYVLLLKSSAAYSNVSEALILHNPAQFTGLVVRQAPCCSEELRLRQFSASIVVVREIFGEKLRGVCWLVVRYGVASTGQTYDDLVVPYLKLDMCYIGLHLKIGKCTN